MNGTNRSQNTMLCAQAAQHTVAKPVGKALSGFGAIFKVAQWLA